MSVEDDAGVVLFFERRCAIATGMHKSNDVREGLRPAMIFENLDIHARWVVPVQTRSKLDGAVNHVIVPDESAYETKDHDGGRCDRVG